MTLDYLDFDYSEDDEGTGTFDAMACVTEAQWARLQHEITQVLQWCHGSFQKAPAPWKMAAIGSTTCEGCRR